MADRFYTVGEVARIAGATIRALHHYDEIGLLKPTGRTESGYRLYSEDDLLRLQQIYIGRALGMTLDDIGRMLDDPTFDRRRALVDQRIKLTARLNETHAMIAALDAALRTLDGQAGDETDPGDLFDGFDPGVFEDEVKERWGDTDAYRESSKRTSKYTKADWARLRTQEEKLLGEFAEAFADGVSADDGAVLELAERHRLHIDHWFYPCSHAMHAGLADMYLADARFKSYFESRGEGLAEYVVEAIRANASRG